MRLALREAKKGLGATSPNPAVGAVIVRDGEIVGKGYHKKAGTPHAEIHALRQAGELAKGATIYVTLEPCNHTGRTPPCTHALRDAGISKVVAGMLDPNPRVNGSGMTYLGEHGIKTDWGVLREECEEINYPFIKYITKGQPWLVMKAGMSLDGRLNFQHGTRGAMTGALTQKRVHQLRSRYDALLVGRNTVVVDDPSLTVRFGKKRRDPVRIVLDTHLHAPHTAKIFNLNSQSSTVIFCGPNASAEKEKVLRDLGAHIYRVDERKDGLDLKQIFAQLAQLNVLSVLVEGGSAVHGACLRHKLYDYAHLFYGNVFAGESSDSLLSSYTAGDSDQAAYLLDKHYLTLGDDFEIRGKIGYPEG